MDATEKQMIREDIYENTEWVVTPPAEDTDKVKVDASYELTEMVSNLTGHLIGSRVDLTLTFNSEEVFMNSKEQEYDALVGRILLIITTPKVKLITGKTLMKKIVACKVLFHPNPSDSRNYIRIGKLDISIDLKSKTKLQVKIDRSKIMSPIIALGIAGDNPRVYSLFKKSGSENA